jgi:hypothetical protein
MTKRMIERIDWGSKRMTQWVVKRATKWITDRVIEGMGDKAIGAASELINSRTSHWVCVMNGWMNEWMNGEFLSERFNEWVPVLFLTEQQAMKTYWGSGSIIPRIIDFGTRWRWVVSFTPRLLYPQEKIPWYPLDRRLCGSQSRSWRFTFRIIGIPVKYTCKFARSQTIRLVMVTIPQ